MNATLSEQNEMKEGAIKVLKEMDEAFKRAIKKRN